MNRNIKKVLSVILCAVLLFTTASVAFAAEETETEISTEKTETEVTEEVTESDSEKTFFEKMEDKINRAIGRSNIPWGFILCCIGYAFLLLFGTLISPFTLPISLILILTGNAGW